MYETPNPEEDHREIIQDSKPQKKSSETPKDLVRQSTKSGYNSKTESQQNSDIDQDLENLQDQIHLPNEIWFMIIAYIPYENRSAALSSLCSVSKNLRYQVRLLFDTRIMRLNISFDTLVCLKSNASARRSFIKSGIDLFIQGISSNTSCLTFEFDSLRLLIQDEEWAKFFDLITRRLYEYHKNAIRDNNGNVIGNNARKQLSNITR